MMATLASTDPARPRLSPLRQAMLSFFWLGTNAHWAAILITTLPSQALQIGGDEVKGRTLSTVLAVGALVSMLVAPLFGALSDRIVTRWGRRVPWVVLGTLMNIDGLFGSNFNDVLMEQLADQGDGVYEFRVRARDNAGAVSLWGEGPGNAMAVDTIAPFIVPTVWTPVVPNTN